MVEFNINHKIIENVPKIGLNIHKVYFCESKGNIEEKVVLYREKENNPKL